jgi:ribosome-associated protein
LKHGRVDNGMSFGDCNQEELLNFTIFALNYWMKNTQEHDPEMLGKTIIDCIEEKKGLNIVHIDLSKTDNSVCEFFIISHADSTTQVKAIAKHIENSLKNKFKLRAYHAEGYENAQWVLLDYGSIVVHVFLDQIRKYYKLEELWADAEVKIVTEPEADF